MIPRDARAGKRFVVPALSAILLGLALLLDGCGLAREALYAPRNDAIVIADWTNAPPREVHAQTADGLRLQGFYWPGDPAGRDIILFFHGRHAHQGVGAKYAQYLQGHGEAVLVASYRGFGGNPGSPSRAGMLKDAAAFIALARALKGPESRLWLVGHSLGGAVALQAAADDGHVAGVVAISTFARMREAAPVLLREMLPDRWNNLDAVARLKVPLLILQGSKDTTIPPDSGSELLAAAHGPAAYVSLLGATHKPYMQQIGPWTSGAIAALRDGDLTALPPLPEGWRIAGERRP